MAMIEITHNVGPLAAKYMAADSIFHMELVHAVTVTGVEGSRRAKSLAPSRSGALRRSIRVSGVRSAAGSVSASYRPHAVNKQTGFPYPVAIEKGRRGFAAKRGRFLRFEVGGRVVFARRVGPAAAQPYMAPSAEYAAVVLNRELRAAVARIRAKLGG